MNEPSTVLTDVVLGSVTLVFAIALFRSRGAVRSRRWWGLALVAAAVAAFTGAAWHALNGSVGDVTLTVLWKATLLSIAAASFALVAAAGTAFLSPGAVRAAVWVAAGKALLTAAVALSRDEFTIAVVDYGISMLFVIVAAAAGWKLQRSAASRIVAGVLLSVIAAAVQQSGFALHRHFNHNDLYHVIQIAANWVLFSGARRVADFERLRPMT